MGEVVSLEDLLVLVRDTVGDNHDGLVAVGPHLSVSPTINKRKVNKWKVNKLTVNKLTCWF